MNKKLFSILFTLFLAGVLSVSCSNKDKTGSDTGGNSKIDSKYEGTWIYAGGSTAFIVKSDGSLELSNNVIPQVDGSGDTYTITTIVSGVTYKMQIKFTSDTTAEMTNLSDPNEPKQNLTKKTQQ